MYPPAFVVINVNSVDINLVRVLLEEGGAKRVSICVTYACVYIHTYMCVREFLYVCEFVCVKLSE